MTPFLKRVNNDDPQMIAWMEGNRDRNSFDAAVLDYPATEVYCAYVGEKIISYLICQPVVVLDAFGPNPEASGYELTKALEHFTVAVGLLAHRSGTREIMFLGSDESTAKASEVLGFTKLETPVWRLRLPE